VRSTNVGRSIQRSWLFVSTLLLASSAAAADAQKTAAAGCRPSGSLARLPEIAEASGIAVSRQVPGRLWAHNDSGEPVIFALDAQGRVTGRVRLTGATVEDWEAIAVGPCPAGSCLYIADIGDNDAERKRITIYRLPEPDGAGATAAVTDVFHATYPDGSHDAETLLVTADGGLYVVTKGETGPLALYKFTALENGGTVPLERVGATAATLDRAARITDGAVSPDGQLTVLRSLSRLTFYRTADLVAGQWREVSRVDLASLQEPQGEAVALGADNVVFLAGEGGTKGQPGTFVRFICGRRG
jgi:hypothetical protein